MGNFIGLPNDPGAATSKDEKINCENGTPIKKMKLADPRSPSSAINRTPVVIKNDPLKVINDPRSPNASVTRTPIG